MTVEGTLPVCQGSFKLWITLVKNTVLELYYMYLYIYDSQESKTDL